MWVGGEPPSPNHRDLKMVEVVKSISGAAATGSEFIAVVVIVIGAIQAITPAVIGFLRAKTAVAPLVVFRGFAGWLVLSLEFLLAADILKSAISPTWNENGLRQIQLAEETCLFFGGSSKV